jgi:O-antigen/teichoic acid export membrane protein
MEYLHPMHTLKERLYALLRFSERYTKTDMVYLASGGFWLGLGQAGSVLLGLATAIAFGHFASQDTYGNYKYVLTLASLFGAFSLSGIAVAVAQATARGYDGSLRQGFALSLKWSWGIVALAFGSAFYYYFFEHNDFLAVTLIAVGILSPFLNSFSLFDSFLSGKQQFRRDTQYTLLNSIFPVAAVIISLFFTERAIVIVLVYFIANVLSDAVFYWLSLRQEENTRTDPGLFSYSGHLSVMGIISTIADKIDSIAIFSLLGPVELAIYTFASAIPEQIKQVANLLSHLALPRFAARPIEQIRDSIWSRIGLLAITMALLLAFYNLLAPLIFSLLFPNYQDAVSYSRWYSLSILFNAVSTVFLAVFQAHRKTRSLYILTNGGSVILIFCLPLLTYYFGIMGAIGAQFIYRAASAGIAAWEFFRISRKS